MAKKERVSKKRKLVITLVTGLAVISFWRGAWQLMDLFVFPNNFLLSNFVSLVVGFVVLVLMHKVIKGLM